MGHPLDPPAAEEYLTGRDILAKAGLYQEAVTRFAYYGLDEPPAEGDRRLRAFLLDLSSGAATDVTVSLTSNDVVRADILKPERDGHLPILDSDLQRVDDIAQQDPRWAQAMKNRGITDLSKVRACPMTAGNFTDGTRRLVRVLAFRQDSEHDLVWAHPIDGITGYVDLIEGKLIELRDEFTVPVPDRNWDYDDPDVRGPYQEPLKPIHITQPEGVGFTLDGNRLRWRDWDLRVGFDAREGLILHDISVQGRPLIRRASIPEMVVPYGDPRFRYWQAYFDTGEYGLGKWANELTRGCDCLGEIAYLDVTVTDDQGEPRVIKQAICIHEEDAGVGWKHTDIFSGSQQVRRQRRLVVSFFATVGNYDYGFYWYFYLDGRVECEVKMTGVLFTSASPGPYTTTLADGLTAPVHQHLFCARLDMSVDGPANAVEEVDVTGLPIGEDNPYGNAIRQHATRLHTESQAQRSTDPAKNRTWRIVNDSTGTAYTLQPEASAGLLAHKDSPLGKRGEFATKALWVTRYDPAHRYPAGDFVNQHPGGAGLPSYSTGDRDIDNQDIVLWHTFGKVHVPRREDWPVMPVVSCGFTLRPAGFFDRNPMLDR